MIKRITKDTHGYLNNFCHRGSMDANETVLVGSYLCDVCKRRFRLKIGGAVLCSGKWTRKDQRAYEKRIAERKAKYGY